MARTKTALAVVEEPQVNEAALKRAEGASMELGHLVEEAGERAALMAKELGYEGSLEVGALEDGIRFYQRRTVEAILETGKRLALLKEQTPHGEFTKRVELLGFSGPTARRFIHAAAKTAKSLNLSDLSTKVKNASAFLELVTHDDDVLESLAELDDIDRMSATQLREALRQSEKDSQFNAEKRQKAEQRADALEKKLAGKRPVVVPLDERITPFQVEITERQSLLEKAIAAHLESATALETWWMAELEGDQDGAEMPQSVKLVLLTLDDAVNRTASLVGALQNELETRFGADISAARQYFMSIGERG